MSQSKDRLVGYGSSANLAEVITTIKIEGKTDKIRAWGLRGEPSKGDLVEIPKIEEFEFGLLHIKGSRRWIIIVGSLDHPEIPQMLENRSDLVAHSHPNDTLMAELPHFNDVYVATISAKQEMLIYSGGLTYYSGIECDPLTQRSWKPVNPNAIESKFFSFLTTQQITDFNDYCKTYELFLKRMGVRLTKRAWDELPDIKPLSTLSSNP